MGHSPAHRSRRPRARACLAARAGLLTAQGRVCGCVGVCGSRMNSFSLSYPRSAETLESAEAGRAGGGACSRGGGSRGTPLRSIITDTPKRGRSGPQCVVNTKPSVWKSGCTGKRHGLVVVKIEKTNSNSTRDFSKGLISRVDPFVWSTLVVKIKKTQESTPPRFPRRGVLLYQSLKMIENKMTRVHGPRGPNRPVVKRGKIMFSLSRYDRPEKCHGQLKRNRLVRMVKQVTTTQHPEP
jgi:hypothetical protein